MILGNIVHFPFGNTFHQNHFISFSGEKLSRPHDQSNDQSESEVYFAAEYVTTLCGVIRITFLVAVKRFTAILLDESPSLVVHLVGLIKIWALLTTLAVINNFFY